MKIYVKKNVEDAQLPTYGTKYSSGADLYAAEDMAIPPGFRKLIDTGLSFQPEYWCDMQIRPRSGLAVKHGVTVLNSPGTIDPDYRGPVKVILINHGKEHFEVRKGMRIAQLVISPPLQAMFVETEELDETVRGEGGFGSTGE